MSDSPVPPPSGLARSIRRLFDASEEGSAGGAPGSRPQEKAPGEGSEASPGKEAPAPPVRARERLTNRLARYLRADESEREALEEPIREDVRTLLEAGDPGPLADAAVALSGDDSTPDALLRILLTSEVAAELADRGVTISRPAQSPAETGSAAGSRSDANGGS